MLLPENLDEEIRAAIDDLGVVAEVGCRPHHAEELDDALDAIEGAERTFERGEDREARLPGGGDAFLDRELIAASSRDERAVFPKRAMARDVDRAPDLERGDVVGDRPGGRRQGDR